MTDFADQLVWVRSDGVQHELLNPASDYANITGFPPSVLLAVESYDGLYMPPSEVTVTTVNDADGAIVTAQHFPPREVTLSLCAYSPEGKVELRQVFGALAGAFNPRSAGILRARAWNTAAGAYETRDLTCRYSDGLGLEMGATGTGWFWQRFAVTFTAHDPYWYSSLATQYTFTVGSAPIPWFGTFPLTFTLNNLAAASQTMVNAGEVEAWPIWTVTGPVSGSIRLANTDTGAWFELSANLDTAETLIIDTRPGVKTVTLQRASGVVENAFPLRTAGSTLWPLTAGSNAITVTVPSASGAASVAVQYTPRYLTIAATPL